MAYLTQVLCSGKNRGRRRPRNCVAAAAGDTYDLSMPTEMPAWREVHALIARELGETVYDARP
jgi:hypothetical protein